MTNKPINSLRKGMIGDFAPAISYNVDRQKLQEASGMTSHIALSLPCMCKAESYLTANLESKNLSYPVKRKQALLGSNLSGIAGVEMSRNEGTRSSGRVPTHHFDPCLRKPKTSNVLSFISANGLILTPKKSVPDFAIAKVWHRYVRSNDRD